MLQTVMFDLFETLVTEVTVEGRMPHTRKPLAADLLGIGRDEFKAAWAERKTRRMTSGLPYEEALLDICAQFGVRPSSQEVEGLVEARKADKATPFSRVPEQVLTMLGDLRVQGCALGLVSNCSVEDGEAFPTSPLSAYFDEIVWSYDVGLQKPDPRIYEVACQRLGSRPADTLFVGDGSFDELEGAGEAGLRPLWASWFVARWPEDLRAARRSYVQHLGVPEASSPRMVTTHCDTTTLPVSVKAVVFNGRGHVLLGLNERAEWELPGGRVEPGETPEHAVVREVLEEAGVAVAVGRHLGDWPFEVVPDQQVLISAYSCSLLDETPVVASTEHHEVRFWPPEVLRDLQLPAVHRQVIAKSQAANSQRSAQ